MIIINTYCNIHTYEYQSKTQSPLKTFPLTYSNSLHLFICLHEFAEYFLHQTHLIICNICGVIGS